VVNGLYHGSVTFASFVMLSLLYVSGSGVMGLTNGLNNIYHLKENRNYPMLRLRSSVYTLLIVVSIIFSFGMLSMGLRFRDLFSSTHPLFMMVQNRVLHYGMILLALVLLTLLFCMLYVLLPNRKKRFRTQLYGAVFTTVSWLIFAEIFRFYLTYAKNLSIIYGGLMTIAVVMLSLYICMYLFFFGAEINAYMENPDSFPF
jgi:membrane protein